MLIPGTSPVAHLRENIAAASLVLPGDAIGLPSFAERITRACAEYEVPVLDARESGAQTSTTMIGGDESIANWCAPVFRSYLSYVRYLGPASWRSCQRAHDVPALSLKGGSAASFT